MNRGKLLTISIIIVIGITPILSGSSIAVDISSNTNDLAITDSHVIEGIPYVGGLCSWAVETMILQYYGINTSMNELFYISGSAYCSASFPPLASLQEIPVKYTCCPGLFLGAFDYEYYESLYGMSLFSWQPENTFNTGKCWNEYWSKIKYYISSDTPLGVMIDPCAWPIYKDVQNWSRTPFFKRGGHQILIVGYNETNGTICFQDPEATYYNLPDKEGYLWDDLNTFRIAVKRLNYLKEPGCYSYFLFGLEKVSESLPKKTIIEEANIRNIEKMKGNKSIYEEIGLDFQNYGIKSIKSLKQEFLDLNKTMLLALYCLKEKILQKFLSGGNAYHNFWSTSNFNYEIKHNVSEFLLENQDISPICKYGGELLENESKCWKNINLIVTELNEIHKSNGLFKSMMLSKPLINEVVTLLDSIITIEQAIIDRPFYN